MNWPRPVLAAREQRQRRAEGSVEAGDVVGHRDGDARGRPVRIAREVAQPAHRLADHAVAGALAVGTVLAEAADAHHHEPRIARAKAAS